MIQPESVEHTDHAYAPAGGTDDDSRNVLTHRLEPLQESIWMKHVPLDGGKGTRRDNAESKL
jgi:hypothetical protein